MPVIRAEKRTGEYVTSVMPEVDRMSTVQELREKGYKNIHDAETGEKYDIVCAECGNDVEDTSTWYREDEQETVCEDCYMEWAKENNRM